MTYPKSLISALHAKNIFDNDITIPTIETKPGTFCNFEDKNYDLVWVFKIERFEPDKVFGKTTRLYIIDRDNLEVLADLTQSLNSGNGTFKKESQETYKKTTYHERGRVENCGVCLGTGMGWQGGICPFCGGKGWYIEHEW